MIINYIYTNLFLFNSRKSNINQRKGGRRENRIKKDRKEGRKNRNGRDTIKMKQEQRKKENEKGRER